MRYIRFVVNILVTVICLSICGQTQQGYVKTLGRPNAKGTALSDVIIKIKGEHNPVKSNNDGVFSIQFQNKKNGDAYALQEVRKVGYELNEPEIVGRQFVVSDKVRKTIVMVSTAQLQADKRRIENNAYNVAEKNYKQKLALLEKEKEDGTITVEKYRKQLQELQNRFEKYQSLIDGLAEHYAHTDYDELNEKECEINICIENGNLERADSLIEILFDPTDVLKRNKEAIAKLNLQILQAEGILDQANADMAAVLKQQEKDAEHLYQLYTIALARFDNEKAGKYIETRAELDTTNIRWQVDVASFHRLFTANYVFAERFLQRALSESYKQYKGWNLISAYVLNDLARTYESMGRMQNADNCYRDAFAIYTHYKDTLSNEIAMLLNNHGLFLMKNEVYDVALHSLEKAREMKAKIYGDNHVELANVYNNMGMVYYYLHNYKESLLHYELALPLFKKLFGEKHANIANCYNNMGITYMAMNDTAMASNYLTKALEMRLSLYGSKHLSVAESFNNIGSLRQQKGEFEKALTCHGQSLSIREELLGPEHTDVAQSLMHIGEVYDAMGNFECIGYYKRALQIYLKSALSKNSEFIKSVATRFYNSYCAGYNKGVSDLPTSEYDEIIGNYVILLTVMDGDTPASRLGMKGQYIVLEFGGWSQEMKRSIFIENNSLLGKPKDIVVYDDSGINRYHFDGNLGAKMELYYIGKEERGRISNLFLKWKDEHR